MRVMCMLKLRELLSCEDVNYLAQPYRLQEKLWQNVKVTVRVTAGTVSSAGLNWLWQSL